MTTSKEPIKDFLQRRASLEEMAKDTFESEEAAIDWMNRPHPLLYGERPSDAAKTTAGALAGC